MSCYRAAALLSLPDPFDGREYDPLCGPITADADPLGKLPSVVAQWIGRHTGGAAPLDSDHLEDLIVLARRELGRAVR
jgi:hypothetical protein